MRSCVILGLRTQRDEHGRRHAACGGVLHGDHLLPPTSSNPKGYFEDRVINGLNEDLLVQVAPVKPSTRWGCLYPGRLAYGHRWLAAVEPTATVHATPEIAAQMQSFTRRRPFCFKDPRFCYTLDAWRPALDDAVFLCVFREPGVTAMSMITDVRERQYLEDLRLSKRRALRIWTLMYEHILDRHRHRGEWLFVHYDQFLDGSAISRVESLLGTRIDSSFVDQRLKRSTASFGVPRQTADIYRQLCELAGLDEQAPSGTRTSTFASNSAPSLQPR